MQKVGFFIHTQLAKFCAVHLMLYHSGEKLTILKSTEKMLSPLCMTIFSSLRLALARSTIFWSTVFAVTSRYTTTGRFWPIRWQRSWACRSLWGFCISITSINTIQTYSLHSLYCADVPLKNCSLAHTHIALIPVSGMTAWIKCKS